jgi:hypothetical protein
MTTPSEANAWGDMQVPLQLSVPKLINLSAGGLWRDHSDWRVMVTKGEDSHKFSSERGDKPPLRAQP